MRMVNLENARFSFIHFWRLAKLLDNENQLTPLQANGTKVTPYIIADSMQ
ncbi:hypothetical protein SLCC85_90208 [Listeria monocytogenes]|nr:hypothetical protein SLCC85_90208 [Listeria monocytogenes]